MFTHHNEYTLGLLDYWINKEEELKGTHWEKIKFLPELTGSSDIDKVTKFTVCKDIDKMSVLNAKTKTIPNLRKLEMPWNLMVQTEKKPGDNFSKF